MKILIIYNFAIILVVLLIIINLWFLIYEKRKSRKVKETFIPEEKEVSSEEYYKQGITYLLKKQDNEAIEAFKKTLKLNPEDSDAHFQLGKIYQEKGEKAKSIAEFKKYLALDKEGKWKEEVENILERLK